MAERSGVQAVEKTSPGFLSDPFLLRNGQRSRGRVSRRRRYAGYDIRRERLRIRVAVCAESRTLRRLFLNKSIFWNSISTSFLDGSELSIQFTRQFYLPQISQGAKGKKKKPIRFGLFYNR